MQAMPFLRLPKPPQSTAARSMPTPRQSPSQQMQMENLLLRKSPPYARPHTEYQNSTRRSEWVLFVFYIHCSMSDTSNAIPEAAKATTINGSPFHANTTAITVAAIAEGKSPVA